MIQEVGKLLKGLSGGPQLLKCLKKLDEDVASGLLPPLVGVLRELRGDKSAEADASTAANVLEGALAVSGGTSVLTPRFE